MLALLRTRIAVRSTAVILVVVGLVGILVLALAIPYARHQEQASQQERLNELLDTVQRTLSIACFLSDKELANEIVLGLLSNQTVSAVAIRAGATQLARQGRTAAAGAALVDPAARPPGALVRKVVSPFNPAETVGEITLVPDAAAILKEVIRRVRDVALLVMALIAIIGLCVAVVVNRFVTRPIAAISARLHELQAETGQKLEVPRGNELDEIGGLVRDVNGMADSLVRFLNEERRLRVDLGNEERKFRAIFENADTGIVLVDESGSLMSWNPAFARLFTVAAAGPGSAPLPTLMDLVGENRAEADALVARCIAEGTSVGRDIKLDARPGVPTRWVNMVVSPLEDRRLLGVVNDITERKRIEEAAQELAATDQLTGLGNRLGFERRIEQMIDGCYRDPGRRFVVLMLDLDWFKQVNDTYGHQAGDIVLVQVARRLENIVRRSDFVGRLGGDEFVVLLSATSEPAIIDRIAKKIIDDIGQPIPIGGGNTAKIGASVGGAVFGGATLAKDELIRRADEAMYQAKRDGRNCHRLYEGDAISSIPAPI